MHISKQELRSQLLTTRRAISPALQEAAAKRLCLNARNLHYFAAANGLALYWPHDGEISPLPLLYEALKQHKHCYLPLLQLKQTLAFASYTLETPLVKNRYGILEPELNYSTMIELADIDIIFIPLVGFDRNGSRLGRGGGCYDATFANLSKLHKNKWPKLVGLAYSCQEVAIIPTDSWDWRLDAVITEEQIFNFNPVSE